MIYMKLFFCAILTTILCMPHVGAMYHRTSTVSRVESGKGTSLAQSSQIGYGWSKEQIIQLREEMMKVYNQLPNNPILRNEVRDRMPQSPSWMRENAVIANPDRPCVDTDNNKYIDEVKRFISYLRTLVNGYNAQKGYRSTIW